MKKLLYFLVLFSTFSINAQSTFIIDDLTDSEISHFSDFEYAQGKYYALSNHVEYVSPWRVYSKLFIYNASGELEQEIFLGTFGHQYFQFHSIDGDILRMAGSIEDTACSVRLVIAQYDIPSNSLQTLSSYDFCQDTKVARRMQFVKGVNGDLFLEGDYGHRISTDNGNTNFVMKIEPNLEFTPVFTNLVYAQHLSIDFSTKGYLIKDTYLIDFYDTEFNKRKQRYNFLDDYDEVGGSFSYPFGSKYILDQVFKNGGDQQGEAIRLLDSNFYIRGLAIISPPAGSSYSASRVSLPRYGGVAIPDSTAIWTTSNFGDYYYSDSTSFSITKLDNELNVVCQQFVGFDRKYRIFGLSPVKDDGVILFGLHLSNDDPKWKGKEEPYAYKVGDHCELISATQAPDKASFAISAYPNPTINSLTFDVNGFEPSTLKVEIFNTAGITFFSKKDLSYEISVVDLPAGQYFYRILQGEKVLGIGSWVKQ